MTTDVLKKQFDSYKESYLKNRYIHLEHIAPLIEKLKTSFQVKVIGKSVLGESIHTIKVGTGSKKILMWSQMHGNESTTTKAIFDICNVFEKDSSEAIQQILKNCTILIIPILNPDGAKCYTRHNANDVDLNRDAKIQTQPESKALRKVFDAFKPDYCFNLHGQRTIFGAGDTKHSAVISFLSPAQDAKRTVTQTRKKAMEIIVATNKLLQAQIPNQVGIYDDTFNENCVGDTFQALNCPTILFEAGHYKDDYNREITRFFMFQSILYSINYIACNKVTGKLFQPYFQIPENKKNHFDIIIREVKVTNSDKQELLDVAIQYQEVLKNNTIVFIPKIEKTGSLKTYYGHREILANNSEISINNDNMIEEGLEIKNLSITSVNYSIKPT